MLNDVLRVFQKDGKYLVLNPTVPSWIVTNRNGVIIINLYDEYVSKVRVAEEYCKVDKTVQKSSVIAFLDKAEKNKLFQIENSVKHHKPYHLGGIYLNMTSACNLHCIYCFAATRVEHGEENLKLTDYYKLLDEARNINPHLEINFTGGEPLLSPNTLPVARYAKEIGFKTRLLSNATLINEDNIDEISNFFDNIKISLDGSTKEKHEYYRGINTYDRTVNAINLLKSKGKNVTVAMVVTRKNQNDVDDMNKIWGNMLIFQPLFPLGKAKSNSYDIALSGKEYFEVLCNNVNINPYADLENILDAHKESRTIIKCSIGDGEISISCTGDVYPCQLLHYDKFLLGNVKDKSLHEIYYSKRNEEFKFNTVDKILKCNECDFKYLCGGACQARHFSETGSIHKAGEFCEYEKNAIVNGLINSSKLIRLE